MRMVRAMLAFLIGMALCFGVVDGYKGVERFEPLYEWMDRVNSGEPKAVAALYDKKAVLLPIFSKVLRKKPAERLDYFEYFVRLSGLEGKIVSERTWVRGSLAVSSGYYTFEYVEGRKKVETKARYTFVFMKAGGTWRIMDHHSSVVPKR